MFNPNTMTVAEAVAALRDIGLLIGLVIFGWKSRSWVQPAVDFFQRINTHLDKAEIFMEQTNLNMQTLMTNHLPHMEKDLKTLSGRTTDEL